MLDKYIQELIENNNRVIIPDFGAFMIQDTPEGKQISFNDFLKFNDGLLINQIIKAEKVSKNQATDKIKDFVKEINDAFSKKQAYEVKGVGFLSKDANGNIKFSATKTKEVEKPVAATDEKPTIILDEQTTKESKTDAKVEDKKPAAKPVAKKEPVAKKTTAPAKEKTKTQTQTNVTSKPTPKPAAKTTEKKTFEKKYATTQNKENNNTTNILIVIFIAIIVLGGGYWASTIFDFNPFKKKEKPVVVEQVKEPVAIPAVDSSQVAVDTVMEEPKVVEEPVETIDPNQKYYYVVAGSFKVPANAQNFNQKLINNGYDSEIVVRNNGFHTVTYSTFTNWKEALSEWRKMRNTDEQTWILIQRGK